VSTNRKCRALRLAVAQQWLLAILLLACAIDARITAAAEEAYSEDAVKAAFLYRFAGYVTWPPQALHAPFSIAVLDDDAVAAELEHALAGRTINELPAQVRRIRNVHALGDAQVLYIGPGLSTAQLQAVLDEVAGRPILVVTDTPDGLNAGSIVNFMLVDRRVRFEVSLPAAERAGLKIGSGLLSVAARVQGHYRGSDTSCVPARDPQTEKRCIVRVAAL